jgi:hypothetical protein
LFLYKIEYPEDIYLKD